LKSFIEKLRLYFSNSLQEYRTIFLVIGGLALVLGAFSFLQPVEVAVPDNISYQHVGIYAYSANAPKEIYSSGKLQSGEVIFPAVTCSVNVSFYYAFSATAPISLQGTYQWTAELSSTNGWRQTILSQPETSFSGSTINTSATVDMCQVENIIQQLEEITNVDNYQYTLTLSPNIKVSGEVGGETYEGDFPASLVFVVEPQQIYLSVGEKQTNPLLPTQSGELVHWKKVVNDISISSLKIPVPVARWISLGGLILAALALIIPLIVMKGAKESAEIIDAKKIFGQRLMEVGQLSLDPTAHTIRVSHLVDLVSLSDQLGEKVLLLQSEQGLIYYIVSGHTVYLYQTMPDAPQD